MTAKDNLTASPDEALQELIGQGVADPRVAEALSLFATASRFAPAPVAHFAPVTYSASGNVAVTA